MIIIIMIKKKLAFCAKAGILQSFVSTSGRNQNNFLTDWPKKFQLSQVSFFTGHVQSNKDNTRKI